MEACLVTTEDSRRARGVLLLAETVAGYVAPASRPSPPARRLCSRSTSRPSWTTSPSSARRSWAAPRSSAPTPRTTPASSPPPSTARAPATSPTVSSTPSTSRASSRRTASELRAHPRAPQPPLRLRPRGPPLGADLTPAEQLETIVAACDGEKDPRNVILVCDIWSTLPRAFCGSADVIARRMHPSGSRPASDLDEHRRQRSPPPPRNSTTSSPRTSPSPSARRRTPRPSITRERLAATLRGAMCASAACAPWAAPHGVGRSLHDKPPARRGGRLRGGGGVRVGVRRARDGAAPHRHVGRDARGVVASARRAGVGRRGRREVGHEALRRRVERRRRRRVVARRSRPRRREPRGRRGGALTERGADRRK